MQIQLESPSGIWHFFLNPAKTHTVAFPGVHSASWIENPARFKQADRQAQEDSRADGFPQVSGGAPGPHQERALSIPGLSGALMLRLAALPRWELEGHQPPQADLTPLPLLEPDVSQPHPFQQNRSPSSP